MTDLNFKIAEEIKSALVILASKDLLPMDMTCLDSTFIEEILDKHSAEIEADKPYESARHYLCDSYDDDGMNVRQQVQAIQQQCERDGSVVIDHVEGVIPWHPIEYAFNCDDFLSHIGL